MLFSAFFSHIIAVKLLFCCFCLLAFRLLNSQFRYHLNCFRFISCFCLFVFAYKLILLTFLFDCFYVHMFWFDKIHLSLVEYSSFIFSIFRKWNCLYATIWLNFVKKLWKRKWKNNLRYTYVHIGVGTKKKIFFFNNNFAFVKILRKNLCCLPTNVSEY